MAAIVWYTEIAQSGEIIQVVFSKRRIMRSLVNICRMVFWVVVVCAFGTSAFGQPWDGSGTAGEPYQIWDACDMQAIGVDSNYWDAHFVLCADVNLGAYTGTSFKIIGRSSAPFTGVFDGNGHTISNFTYQTDASYIGLFGYINHPNAVVRDLSLIDPNIDAGTGDYVGPLVGNIEEGTISGCGIESGNIVATGHVGGLVGVIGYANYGPWQGGSIVVADCYAAASVTGLHKVGGLAGGNYGGIIAGSYSTGNISGNYSEVGGLVGANYDGDIFNSYSTASITGDYSVGGLAGSTYEKYRGAEVSNCYATGSVIATSNRVGGLVGYNQHGVTVSNCYSTSSVTGDKRVGGLVGANYGPVSNCYSSGIVSGTTPVGGLVGEVGSHSLSAVHASYWDIETSGQASSAGGIGRTTADMQAVSTFIGWGGCGNEGVWTIDDGNDYPRFWWQNLPGEMLPAQNLSDFLAGTGGANDPYMIETAEQLNMVGQFWCDWDSHFKLMADIDLSVFTGMDFRVIGCGHNYAFTGVFDGSDYTISNFTYDSNGMNYVGIFGYVDHPNAKISNVRLIDPNIDTHNSFYVASLVGSLSYGTITNCFVQGGRISGKQRVGGLVGYNYRGDISNSYSSITVSGEHYVGGLVADNYRGGISNSYSLSPVSGDDFVGGLVGGNASISGDGKIFNCYSVGSVMGTGSPVGGLVGYDYVSSSYTKSFWDSDVNPDVNGIGNGSDPNVIGKTTTQMQTRSTFTDAGWDFVDESDNGIEDIWRLCNEGTEYPRLNWQYPLGDFSCPDGVDMSDLRIFCDEWLLEELSVDFWPDGGDGIVNFMDWAILADGWEDTYDIFDLADFANEWLRRGIRVADIAPYGGDGIVNMLDYAVLADNWLVGP